MNVDRLLSLPIALMIISNGIATFVLEIMGKYESKPAAIAHECLTGQPTLAKVTALTIDINAEVNPLQLDLLYFI